MGRRGYINATVALAAAAAVLLLFCSLCAPIPAAMQTGHGMAVFGASGTVAPLAASLPRAADENLPAGLTLPSSGANFAKIPARSGYFKTCAVRSLRPEHLSVLWMDVFLARPAEAVLRMNTPEFTPFLYIKTTHKRE